MNKTLGTLAIAAALAAGAAWAEGPGAMQVEEPAVSAPPINPESESLSWQARGKSKDLTDAQKAARKERQDRMKEMVALIKAKRKALNEAEPGEKAELARELHNLILENRLSGDDDGPGASDRARERQEERRALHEEKMRELKERLREKLEEKKERENRGQDED